MLLFLIGLITICLHAVAQDVIIKVDKTEIQSKVLEITEDAIKYKKFEFLDGPIYSIKKTDVFMIIYQNGKKEYIESTGQHNDHILSRANVQPSENSNNNIAKTDSDALREKENSILSLAINDSGDSGDLEFYWFEIGSKKSNQYKGKLYFGTSFYGSFGTSPTSGGTYPFLAYKYPLDDARNFYLWANAGYNFSYVGSYTDGSTEIPSSSSSSFLWEAGADYFFSKHFGLTAYLSDGSSGWFGLVWR